MGNGNSCTFRRDLISSTISSPPPCISLFRPRDTRRGEMVDQPGYGIRGELIGVVQGVRFSWSTPRKSQWCGRLTPARPGVIQVLRSTSVLVPRLGRSSFRRRQLNSTRYSMCFSHKRCRSLCVLRYVKTVYSLGTSTKSWLWAHLRRPGFN